MNQYEAKSHGFALSRVVSLTDLVDELKSKDSEDQENKKSLDEWLNKSLVEVEISGSESEEENNADKKTNLAKKACLSFATASFAVKFLKTRQAKLAKKKYEETECYKNNDILPSSIPVDIYLESLKTLKSQKEHRKVDLFKELRLKKSVKRRDASFQKTISRLKQGDTHGKTKDHKKPLSPHHTQRKTKSNKQDFRMSDTGALFENDCMSGRAGSRPGDDSRGLSKAASWQRLTPPPSPAPYGCPVRSRPVCSTREEQEGGQEEEEQYNRKMEATLSDMIAEYDHNSSGGGEGGSESYLVAAQPFGTPLRSRPLCRIYSNNER